MARAAFRVVCWASLIATSPLLALQEPPPAAQNGRVRISVVLVDANLNVKPVPKHVLLIEEGDGGPPVRLVTDLTGVVEAELKAGTYVVQSERPVEFQGRAYRWRQPLTVKSGQLITLELSIDNDLNNRAAPDRLSGPQSAAAATTAGSSPAPLDLRAEWEGQYAGASGAKLTIDRQEAADFSGTLAVPTQPGKDPTILRIEGKLVQSGGMQFAETKVLRLGAARSWRLGINSGDVRADGEEMRGAGSDAKTPYSWSFARRPGEIATGPAHSDLRGEWEGRYADLPARLVIQNRNGEVFWGVLTVTSSPGKEPSEIDVELTASPPTVQIKEIKVIRRGAAGKWRLGSSSGTVQPDGGAMSGAGKVGSTSYDWSFTRAKS